MTITFTDEDLMYLDKQQDMQFSSIRQAIDEIKAKGNSTFCKKCGHLMQYFTIGNAKLMQCGFCGNRIAEMIELGL
jgi:NADH pyrophosphatase NudC (nudix superfamily)